MHPSTIIATLREHERELRSAGVEHLSLFGSWARAPQSRRSRISISSVTSTPDANIRCLDRVRLENRLADILGTKVDLVPAQALKDGIRERAVRQAVLAF